MVGKDKREEQQKKGRKEGDKTNKKVVAPRVRLELTTYRLTAGRAADCAIQELIPW